MSHPENGSAPALRSYVFRREREASWQRLESLLAKIDDHGLASLDAEERYLLPALYHAALSSLSVARAISLDRNVVDYLESLASRAYVAVYGSKRGWRETVADFVVRGFPATVYRLRGAVLTTLALLVLGAACGYVAVTRDADLYFSFVPEWLAGDRSPAASREELAEALGPQPRCRCPDPLRQPAVRQQCPGGHDGLCPRCLRRAARRLDGAVQRPHPRRLRRHSRPP